MLVTTNEYNVIIYIIFCSVRYCSFHSCTILMKINRTRFGVHFDATLDANVRFVRFVYCSLCSQSIRRTNIIRFFSLLRACQIHSFVGWAADASIYFFNAIFFVVARFGVAFYGIFMV